MTKINVTLLEMEHHFLYLPVYFARQMKFFGQIPPEYTLSIEQSAAATDEDTYRRLSRGDAHLAICDPCAMIYAAQPSFVPVVLAGLVVRGAFWAVNTHSPEISELDQLTQFEHIVAFHRGTTSYGIAQRIVRMATGTPPIIDSVKPLQELTRLEDLVRDKKSAVALSPDVLRIEASKEANKDWLEIKLALADTIEYGHLLVTAVLTRADFVASHPQFVAGFLRALQLALIYTRAEHPLVLDYASESFHRPPETVKKALTRACDAQIWAPSIAVSEDLWLTAVHAHHDSIGTPFDAAAKQEAKKHFADSFKPQIAAAKKAAIDLVCEKKEAPRREPWKTTLLVASGIAIGLFSLLAWTGHHAAHLALALCVIALPTVADFKGKRDLVWWNALLFALFAGLWILHWKAHWASDEAYGGIIVVLVLPFVEANFKVISKHRGDD